MTIEAFVCPEYGSPADIFRVARERPSKTRSRYLLRHVWQGGACVAGLVAWFELARYLERDAGGGFLLRMVSVPFVIAGLCLKLCSPRAWPQEHTSDFPYFADSVRRRTAYTMAAMSVACISLAWWLVCETW